MTNIGPPRIVYLDIDWSNSSSQQLSGRTYTRYYDAFVAAAVSETTGNIDIAECQATEKDAEELALQRCGVKDCRIILSFSNGYGVIVEEKLPDGCPAIFTGT